MRGEIIVENPIPDTNLYVDGEPFFRDLFVEPAFFRRAEGVNIMLTVLTYRGWNCSRCRTCKKSQNEQIKGIRDGISQRMNDGDRNFIR